MKREAIGRLHRMMVLLAVGVLPGASPSMVVGQTINPRVAITPLDGLGGSRCGRTLLEEARRLRIDVGDWHGPPLSSRGPFKALVDQLTLVPFDIVIHGRVKEDHLVLEAYRTRPIKLLGLVAIRTPGRCKLDVKGNSLFAKWWAGTVLPRAQNSEPFALPSSSGEKSLPTVVDDQFVEVVGGG